MILQSQPYPLNTSGNFIWVILFFFFFCSRMGLISVSGRRCYLKELFGGMLQFYLEQFEMIIVLKSNSHSRFLQKILQFIWINLMSKTKNNWTHLFSFCISLQKKLTTATFVNFSTGGKNVQFEHFFPYWRFLVSL